MGEEINDNYYYIVINKQGSSCELEISISDNFLLFKNIIKQEYGLLDNKYQLYNNNNHGFLLYDDDEIVENIISTNALYNGDEIVCKLYNTTKNTLYNKMKKFVRYFMCNKK